MTPADLRGRSRRELAALARAGQPVDPAALAGHVYEGTSLALPRVLERLTWIKFAKAFHREPDGRLRGWNIRVVDDGLDRAWTPKRRGGRMVTFGHFAVIAGAGGVELDYGWIRDPLVAIDEGGLVLGYSAVTLAGRLLPTPSWFVLRRGAPLTEIAAQK